MMQVLTPADEIHHINKHNFKVPFVCGCRDLGEALRRIAEGAAMIRTKVGGPKGGGVSGPGCSDLGGYRPGPGSRPDACGSLCCPLLCCCCWIEQGEAGTGNVVEAVRHCRAVMGAVRALQVIASTCLPASCV